MSNFIHFLQQARLTLIPRSWSSEIRNPTKGFRDQRIDKYLQDFRQEFSNQYKHLNENQKSILQNLIHNPDFKQAYLDAGNKTSFLLTTFQNQFANFSPLHPAYPILNSFADVNQQLEGIYATGPEIHERLLNQLNNLIR